VSRGFATALALILGTAPLAPAESQAWGEASALPSVAAPAGWVLPPPLPPLRPAAAAASRPLDVVGPAPRGPIPPGLLRYAIPEGARPYAVPYALVGTALLVADEAVLRTLKLDSLYIREDGGAAHQAHLVFRAFSRIGDPPVMAAALAGLYLVGGSRERNAARVGGVAYGNALVLTGVGKYLTGKERPYVSGGRVRYHGPNREFASFPSGHASGTASVAHVLAHYYPDARAAWYGTTAMVGVSRIALARHWPSDVWWGWATGVAAGEGALGARERIEPWRPW
jgi:membrane-associated phospholipid phosphatase